MVKRFVWYCSPVMKAREIREYAQAYMKREMARKSRSE
jgi:hypothetical protein